MSAYLCSEDTINALATYAFSHSLTEDATLFADLLTLTNVRAMQQAYPGREWLMRDVIEPAMAYRWTYTERTPAEVAKIAEEFDYQACEWNGWDASLCKRIVNRVYAHASKPDSYYEGYDPNDGLEFIVERGNSGAFWWVARAGEEHHGPFDTAKEAWNDARRAL